MIPAGLGWQHLGNIYLIQVVFVQEVGAHEIRHGQLALYCSIVAIKLHIVAAAPQEGISGHNHGLSAIRKGEDHCAAILYVHR